MDKDLEHQCDNIRELAGAARAEIANASNEFRLWQRAHFWTWAIALGRDEVRDELKPKNPKWTAEHNNRLTTIMCQLDVTTVCKYLTSQYYTRGRDIDFG
ncbi:hypothetical protein H4R35_007607 [Dimargaris xerosporica]|nr:hypothetical protein H4R35_007607 [Dimargaris xerosporica]